MILLSCSGTRGGIQVKLANRGTGHNCVRFFTHPQFSGPLLRRSGVRKQRTAEILVHGIRYYDLRRVVNKRIIANAVMEQSFDSVWRKRRG